MTDELTALRARVAGLEGTLAYYAHPMNWNSGDVPGHTYAHDDGGAQAREALGLPARVPAPKEWETGVLCSEIALSSINDPRDARIAGLEAALREGLKLIAEAQQDAYWRTIERAKDVLECALGEETRGG